MNEPQLDVAGDPYPPWVAGGDQQLRWDMARLNATAVSAGQEEGGQPNAIFVWYAARALFDDRHLPLGPRDEVMALITRAKERGLLAFIHDELDQQR